MFYIVEMTIGPKIFRYDLIRTLSLPSLKIFVKFFSIIRDCMVTDVYIIVLPAAALCVPKVIIFTRSFPKHEKNHEARSQLVCCLEQHEKRLRNLLKYCLIINYQSS